MALLSGELSGQPTVSRRSSDGRPVVIWIRRHSGFSDGVVMLSLRALRAAARCTPVALARLKPVALRARAIGGCANVLARHVPVSAPSFARGLCGVTIDKTCRVYSCKVSDDAMAHQLDLLMDEFIEHAESLEGYAGAARCAPPTHPANAPGVRHRRFQSAMPLHHSACSPPPPPSVRRLVCKSEWDYKLILKFHDLAALKDFMANAHPQLQETFNPRFEELIGGKLHEQNFVCARSLPLPPRCAELPQTPVLTMLRSHGRTPLCR